MSDEFTMEIIDGREEVVAIKVHPEPVRITAKDIGTLLANSRSDDQATLLWHWNQAIRKWPIEAAVNHKRPGNWSMQCLYIAESLHQQDPTACDSVASMLEEIAYYLRDVPVKHESARLTDTICDSVKELLK